MKTMQKVLNDVSSLMDDMALKGASSDEIKRVIKHSRIVMNASRSIREYHESYVNNQIAELEQKYLGKRTDTENLEYVTTE